MYLILNAYLFFNPIYVTLIIGLLNKYINRKRLFTNLILIFSFSLFFFNRDYGVDFYPNANDDVPVYVTYFLNLSDSSFLDIINNFIKFPSGNEPLWHFFWLPVNLITQGNSDVFIFLHYFLIFYLLLFISKSVFSKNPELVFILLLTFFQFTLYNVTHLWRQFLAFEVFIIGLLSFKKSSRIILIFSSFLIHISSLYYIALYYLYIFLNKFIRSIYIKIFFALLFIFLFFNTIAFFLGNYFERIAYYTQGLSADRSFQSLKGVLFSIILFTCYKKSAYLKNKNILFYIASISFLLPLIIPQFNAIYDRYYSLSFILLAIFLIISSFNIESVKLLIRSKFNLVISITLLIFSSYKLISEYFANIGAISYIASGKSLSPLSGVFFNLNELFL